MQNLFTSAQIERLKREAKKLCSTTSFTHSQALDSVAAKYGYRNWSLLSKHSLSPDDVLHTFDLNETLYPGGDAGVYIIRITVTDKKLRSRLVNENPHFDLPNAKGWIFHPATEPQNKFAPFIDVRFEPRRAVFVNGEWQAILSRNGISDADLKQHIDSTLQPMLNELRIRTATALEFWREASEAPRRYRLFYTKPQNSGISRLAERSYTSIDEAKNALLPDGCVKIGIPVDDGWLRYQAPFGWQGPFDGGPSAIP